MESYIDNDLSSQYSGSNFDNYIYVVWKVVVKGTATQEWTLNITDETFADSIQGDVVGYRYLGTAYSYQNYAHSVSSDGTEYTVGSSTDRTINTGFYVVTAYDKSKYESLANGDYDTVVLDNTVTVTADPCDQIDQDIVKQASANTTWGEYQWNYDGDGLQIKKWAYSAGSSSKMSTGSYNLYKELYDLNSSKGLDTSDFHFLCSSDETGYPMTHVLPIDNGDGTVSMTSNTGNYIDGSYYQIITYDDILYLYPNGATQYGQALTKEDYYFDAVTITVEDYGYDIWEDATTECETIDSVDQNVYVYALFFDSTDWEYVGETAWNANDSMTYIFPEDAIEKDPYRVKVVHNGVGYESKCSIDLYLTLRPNAPTISDATETYESKVGGEVTYLNIENLEGVSSEQFSNNKSVGYVHDQGTDNGKYEEYDSKTGETLEEFTRNLYGILLIRDNAYINLTGLDSHASASKSVSLENDSVNERVLANYYLTAYEGYYASSQSIVDQLKEAGLALPDRNEVVYYDLLPYGMEFNASAGVSVGRITSLYGNSWQTNSRAWDSADVSVSVGSQDVIPNWNGTGRTLIKFHIHYTGDDASSWSNVGYTTSNSMWFEGFGLYFQAYYDWSMINEADSQYNIAAYIVEDSSSDLLGGHNSEVYKDDGSYNGSSAYNPFKISDLNGDGITGNYTNMYASARASTNVATSFTSSISKKVRADSDIVADYGNISAVGIGQGYTYQIAVTNAGSGTLSDIVLYDNLEYAVELGRTDEAENRTGVFNGLTNDEIQNHWFGTFNGLSIDALTDLGINVIVYYNANRNAAISDGSSSSPADALTEAQGWYKAEDWSGALSDVKAIAVDISHYTDGSEVKLDSGESLAFDVHMIAPTAYDGSIYAFNNTSYYSVNTSAAGESISSTESSSTVRVELADIGEVEVIKYSDGDIPSQMTNAKFTFVLTRKDEILPNQQYVLYTWDGEDWADSGVVSATDINGEFTMRADQKAVFTNLANYEDVNVEEMNNIFWSGDLKQSSGSNTLVYTFTNTYRSPVYLYKTALTTDLASDAELEEAEFTFKIYVDTDGDGTYEVYSNGLYAYVSDALTDGSSPEIIKYDYTDANGQIAIGINDVIAFFPVDQDGNVIDVDYQIVETNIGDDWIVGNDTVSGTTSVYGKSSTITNYYKYRTLTLTKDLTNYDHDFDACEYEWTFKITDANGKAVSGNHWYMIDEDEKIVLDEKGNPIEGYLDKNGEFTFSGAGDGCRVVIEGLIAGEEYTVTETEYDDTAWESMGDGVYTMPNYSVDKSGTITNKFLLKDLSVSKLLLSSDSETAKINNAEFTFTLEKLTDNNKYEIVAGAAYTIDGVEYKTDQNGQFTLKNNQTVVFDDIGYEHDEYRVTETADDTYQQIYPVENQPYESELGVDGDSVQFVNGDFENVASFTKILEGADDVGNAYTDIVKNDSQEKTLTYIDPTVAFAVYSYDDNSFTFYAVYNENEIPEEGSEYKGKSVTYVYTGFDTAEYVDTGLSTETLPPWYFLGSRISFVAFDKSFAGIQPIATAYWFYSFSNCERINGLEYLNTCKITNMSYMFRGCSSLTELDVSSFDTSLVTNMSNMFYNCNSLTNLDVSSFNTSLVTDMSGMFYNCSDLTELNVSRFDTSLATDLSSMFSSCKGLTELNVSNFDTSSATNLESMFRNCSSLTELDVSGFDTSRVTNMSSMFYYCNSLTKLDLSGFDTSRVTNMYSMFHFCNSLIDLDISGFDTGEVSNMSYMFYYCSSLTKLNVSSFDTMAVTNMSYMFYSCSQLTDLDISNFDTRNVTDMSSMFANCRSLITIYSNDANFVTTQVTSGSTMFVACSELVGGNGTTYNNLYIDHAMAHVDTASNPGYFTDISKKISPSNISPVSLITSKTNSVNIDAENADDAKYSLYDTDSTNIESFFDTSLYDSFVMQEEIQDDSSAVTVPSYYSETYITEDLQTSAPSMLSFTYDNDPTLSGVYSVPVTIGIYNSDGTLVTDEAGKLTSFTFSADYSFIYISQDGTIELFDYNGGFIDITIYPYDYVYVSGLSDGKLLKVTESSEMSHIIYTAENSTSSEIGSDYILSEGKVMTGTAAANGHIELVNVISTANPYSEIYKLMTATSYEVSTGSRITFRVEQYNASSNTWAPASGISYIILDGYTGDNTIFQNAVSGLLQTGSDGKIVLTKTDNGYPYIRFVEDEVYANIWSGMADGQLRIVELADETDEDWGWLAGYDGTGWVNGSVLDVYYADTFIDANYTVTTTEDDPAVQHFEVEKYMENDDGSSFTFQLKEITAVSELPITSASDILSSVVGANVFYVVYDTETGERVSSGYTDSNGQFTLKAGQYAVFDVPDGTSWIVNEIIKTGYELTDSAANTSEAPEATIIDTVNGVYQIDSSPYLTHSIVLTLVDSNGAPLAGGTFDLYKDEELIQSGLVTDANGQIIVYLLEIGEYHFVQTIAPNAYRIPDDANTETIVIDGTSARSETYYIYVSDADSYNVKYAVTIYGIYQDVDKNGNKLGLTFGPATGKSYINTYDAHLTKEEYESGNNGICLHWMSWEEIIEQSEKDADAFQNCLKNGCTHSVELKLNDTLCGTDYNGEMDDGDGAGMLYSSINSDYLTWNGLFGLGNSTNEGGWPASKVRANLNGKDKYTNTNDDDVAGGDYTLDSDHALISCFPIVLQEAIVPKAVKSDTMYNKQTDEYNMTTYDKLWLLSGVELYGDSGSSDSVIRSLEGELYQRSELLDITTSNYENLISYYETGNTIYWWVRSVTANYSSYAHIVRSNGSSNFNFVNSHSGIAPSFCLK